MQFLLQRLVRLVGFQQDQQIDVRLWIQLSTSVAADRDQRNMIRHRQQLPDLVQVAVDQPAVRAEQPRRVVILREALFEGQPVIA